MYQNIFDSHAHYDDEKFDPDRAEIIESLPEKGVCHVVNIACDMPSCETGIALTEAYPFFSCSVGVHPHAASSFIPGDLDILAGYTSRSKLGLACDLGFPVVIHDREAHADTMELLKKYRPQGIVHCYSGSAEMAKEILKLGMYLGFGGAVTFKNARKTLEAAAAVPLDRLLVETDCPYMSPVPFRGQRCDSAMISHTAERLAELHGIPAQELLDRTCENAERVYRLTDVQR